MKYQLSGDVLSSQIFICGYGYADHEMIDILRSYWEGGNDFFGAQGGLCFFPAPRIFFQKASPQIANPHIK